MTFSLGEPVELLVTAVIDCPSTANCTIGEFGTIRVNNNCMVCKRLEPFFVELLWLCRFVGVWRNSLRHSSSGCGCCPVLQLAQYKVFTEVI
jgi:hypothetical protein